MTGRRDRLVDQRTRRSLLAASFSYGRSGMENEDMNWPSSPDDVPALLREAGRTPPEPQPDDRTSAPAPRSSAATANAEKAAPRLRRLPVDEHLAKRGDEARRALDEAAPSAAADERILHELVAKQLPVALMLHDLEAQLAVRLGLVIDDPKLALAVAKTLRETIAMASAMSKRIQSTLSTAATLRAQRRFLALHGRLPESKSDV